MISREGYWNLEVETMSIEQIKETQLIKLKRQLTYLYSKSEFYRKKLKDVGFEPGDINILDDLRKIPFSRKDELRKSQEIYPPLGEHGAANLQDVVRIHTSSGTSGNPTIMGLTQNDRIMWAEVISRCYYCRGLRKDDRIVLGMNIGLFGGGLPVVDAILNIGATLIPVGTGSSQRLVTLISKLNVNILSGTPSYALYLAEFIKNDMGLHPNELGVEYIFGGAEPGIGIPTIRNQIELEWGASALEALGNADIIPVMFAECHQKDGMHFLAPDFVIVELEDSESGNISFLDSDGRGELIYTALDRECVPLLRYRTGDVVEVKTDKCPCGRTGPKVRVLGRSDDMLIIRGINVFPSAIREIIGSFYPRATNNIRILLHSQHPQRIDPPLNIQVEQGENPGDLDALKNLLEKTLRDKLTFRARIELVEHGTLPRFEGKARLVEP